MFNEFSFLHLDNCFDALSLNNLQSPPSHYSSHADGPCVPSIARNHSSIHESLPLLPSEDFASVENLDGAEGTLYESDLVSAANVLTMRSRENSLHLDLGVHGYILDFSSYVALDPGVENVVDCDSPFPVLNDPLGLDGFLTPENTIPITYAPVLPCKELPAPFSCSIIPGAYAQAPARQIINDTSTPVRRSPARVSPYSSPFSSTPSLSKLPTSISTRRLRNSQIRLSDSDFMIALAVAVDALVCPVPSCGYAPSDGHRGDLKRHLNIHRAPTSREEWMCCGLPVPPDRACGKDLHDVYEYKGLLMAGGCQHYFSRKDALVRHLKTRKGRCRGDIRLAERLSQL
ncbi:uncharacterized protein FIBRA_09164 [Fibroporia radiculosa]|uniref:Uncharacterized protein n=1 Tax=Fibroporia radiculosa TaxID=599839 RepID=J4GJ17_9APHY|nr:uncharacterized protein FIBRA_09164 [Fibroporia radiculosa]CCM06858.1 predicted protein [Fibroporia radiculosa]